MIENKKTVYLINFIETYKEVIGEMGGIPYFTEVYNFGVTEVAFETKLKLMIQNYKKMEIIKFATNIEDTMTISHMEEAMDKY